MSTNTNNADTLTAFAFRQHFHVLEADWRSFPQHYLLYASTGAFHLEVADNEWLLPPHRAAWISADTPIRVRVVAPATCASVLFAKASLAPFDFSCRVFAISALAREMIQYAMRWNMNRDANDAHANAFFEALAAVCIELAAAPDQYWLPRARSRELARAIAYLRARIAEPLSMREVAQHAGISERTLARRFADETAMSWRQYLHRARMIYAMELLAAPSTAITEVVSAVGFESISAFSTAFRRFSGATPTAYRKHLIDV